MNKYSLLAAVLITFIALQLSLAEELSVSLNLTTTEGVGEEIGTVT